MVCKWHFLHVGNKQQRHGCEVGPRIEITFRATVTTLSWHHKGDYLGTVGPSAGAKGVSVHQLSKGRTQAPFTKSPGLVQSLSFHPSRPFLFVATQQYVKIYNLVEQKLVKKLISGVKWISSMAILNGVRLRRWKYTHLPFGRILRFDAQSAHRAAESTKGS